MNEGRGLDEKGSEDICCSETNGAVLKGGMAPFVIEIGIVVRSFPKKRKMLLLPLGEIGYILHL
jgi:hypothetical protein